jgi:hypothetical protein
MKGEEGVFIFSSSAPGNILNKGKGILLKGAIFSFKPISPNNPRRPTQPQSLWLSLSLTVPVVLLWLLWEFGTLEQSRVKPSNLKEKLTNEV